jgi:hypothetical protein
MLKRYRKTKENTNIENTVELQKEVLALKDLVDKLRDQDPKRLVFGSNSHGYSLRSPLSEQHVQDFETLNGIRLPEDYRLFLTTVASSGAGPYYGITPLMHHRAISGLSKPFPWTEKCEMTDEEYDLFWESPLGCLDFCHQGCAGFYVLVVNGTLHGQMCEVWEEWVRPTGYSFLEWYRHWAEQKLGYLATEPLADKVKVGMHRKEVEAILGLVKSTWLGSIEEKISAGEYYAGFTDFSGSITFDRNDKVLSIARKSKVECL